MCGTIVNREESCEEYISFENGEVVGERNDCTGITEDVYKTYNGE